MLLLIIVIILALCYIMKPKGLSSIPGPTGWPFIGNALQLDIKRPYVTMSEWATTYGGVYKISAGWKQAVIVTGTDELNEMFSEKGTDFAGRPETFRVELSSFNYTDVTFAKYGEKWKKLRKLLFQGLKQHNLKHIEEVTKNVIIDSDFHAHAIRGEAFDPSDIVKDTLLQILYIMIFSKSVDKESDEVKLILKCILAASEANGMIGDGGLLDIFPIVRHFGNKSFEKIAFYRKNAQQLYSMWKSRVESSELQDCWFTDVFAMKNKDNTFSNDNIMMVTWTFFGAGLSTSVNIITTFLNVLCHYPDVQKSIQQEVDKVVGQDRQVELADRDAMPYTQACILEILRYLTVTPFAPHVTTASTTLGGHSLPSGTSVIPNTWGQHHDPTYWQDPFMFNPDRFLNSDGRPMMVNESPRKHLFAFGGGPRACPGETLALTRIFLIITHIAQKFTVLPESTIEKQPLCHPANDFHFGLVLVPKPFKIRMVERY